MMTALFSLSHIPDKKRTKAVLIPLPNPMFGEKSVVCVFSKDPQKKYKELLLQEHKVPGITKVISVEKLRKNYRTFDNKRSLADAFDLFLCDKSVVEMMPQILGTVFYHQKKKPPIPVAINPKDPKPALQKAIGGTTLRVPEGPTVGVRIGPCSMSEEELVANAATVIAHVARHFAENPLQSINLQATSAPALPVWRRTATPGSPLDLKKHASDAGSSSASDTGVSGTPSDTETGDSQAITSDVGEALSELDSWSDAVPEDLDEEAGDVDVDISAKGREDLPLVQGLKTKKRKLAKAKAKSGARSRAAKAKKARTA